MSLSHLHLRRSKQKKLPKFRIHPLATPTPLLASKTSKLCHYGGIYHDFSRWAGWLGLVILSAPAHKNAPKAQVVLPTYAAATTMTHVHTISCPWRVVRWQGRSKLLCGVFFNVRCSTWDGNKKFSGTVGTFWFERIFSQIKSNFGNVFIVLISLKIKFKGFF